MDLFDDKIAMKQVQADLQFKYRIIEKIGEGSFGKIFKAQHLEKKYLVAIKQISVVEMDPLIIPYMVNEINMTIKINQQNTQHVVKFYDRIETKNCLYLILEHLQIDLEDIRKIYFHERIPEDLVISILRQLMASFGAIHQENILHRDVKTANIMIQMDDQEFQDILNSRDIETTEKGQLILRKGIIKLIDFGLGKTLCNENDLAETQAGSPIMMAPEIHFGQKYGRNADLFSLGVLLYQILMGNFPFIPQFGEELIDCIQRTEIKFDNKVSVVMQNLIRNMLTIDPSKRISWQQIYEHQYLRPAEQINKLELELEKCRRWYGKIQENDNKQFGVTQEKDNEESIEQNLQKTQFFDDQSELDQDNDYIRKQYAKMNTQNIYLCSQRNKYYLIFQALESLQEITDLNIQEEEKLIDYKSLFFTVTEYLNQKLQDEIKGQLQVNPNSIESDIQKKLQEDILQIEKLQNNIQIDKKSLKPARIFHMAKSLFKGKVEIPQIYSKEFPFYYQQKVKECLKSLILIDSHLVFQGEKTNQHLVFIRIAQIKLLQAYISMSDLLIEQSVDNKLEEISQAKNLKNPDSLLEIITSLLEKMNIQLQ